MLIENLEIGELEKIVRIYDNKNEQEVPCPILMGTENLGFLNILGEKKIYSIAIGFSGYFDRFLRHSKYIIKLNIDENSVSGSDLYNLLKEIGSISNKSKRNLFFLADEFVLYLANFIDKLENIYSIHPSNLQKLFFTFNKIKFYEWCKQNNIVVPEVYGFLQDSVLSMTGEITWPVMIKPAFTFKYEKFSGQKNYVAVNEKELFEVIENFKINHIDCVIQKYIIPEKSKQYSYCGYIDSSETQMVQLYEKDIYWKNSTAISIALADNPSVKRLAEIVVKKLNCKEFFELELMHDLRSNEIYVIEINYRIWTQVAIILKTYPVIFDKLFFRNKNNHEQCLLKYKRWISLIDFFKSDRYNLKQKFKFLFHTKNRIVYSDFCKADIKFSVLIFFLIFKILMKDLYHGFLSVEKAK